MSEAVDPQILAVALDRVQGKAFEDFVNELQAALVGAAFVPVGGVADGGADGYVDVHLLQEVGRPDHFLQTSVQEKLESKIRRTIRRLREVRRDPRVLTYFTSRAVQNSEQLEYELGNELNVLVRLRDRKYIAAQINNSVHTRAAFTHHLEGLTLFLRRVGASSLIGKSSHVQNPDVFVFLRQEVDRRQGDAPLADSVVDSLAVWALEGTDPDAGITMTAEEVAGRIISSFPAARTYVESSLTRRLRAMSAKKFPGGRLVRWHKKAQTFVLPYETRNRIALDNAEDEALRVKMLDELRERFASLLEMASDSSLAQSASEVIIRTLQLGFEREGLEFAHFVSRGDEQHQHYHYLADALAAALDEVKINPKDRDQVGDAAIEVLRQLFYASTSIERDFLERLSRTYAILFTLQAEPRLIEYFEEMSGEFYLYVGSDLLIRAISERYLPEPDQMTRNMLRMAATAGATLVLAEPVLEEVVSHLRASDFEYRNNIRPVEAHVTLDLARHASRILIRAYLYAHLNPSEGQPQPGSWPHYVSQFCDYRSLHDASGYTEIRSYLQAQFGLRFESRETLEGLVSARDVAELAEEISTVKSRPELADNDALMCHAVYGRREELEEFSKVSEFGYRTWWLTGGETSILQFTRDLVRKHNGDRFMMRPEFLLNFISLSPRTTEARATFKAVFPTLLGVRIARRMDEASYHKLMDSVEDAVSMEDGRRQAKMAQLANSLKSDMRRQYRVDFVADKTMSNAEFISTTALE